MAPPIFLPVTEGLLNGFVMWVNFHIFPPIFLFEKILYFSLRKNQLFFCVENSVFFRVEKSGIFAGRPVLDTGRDSGTVDSGQWTVDAGQVDSGRDRVDRTTVLTLEY